MTMEWPKFCVKHGCKSPRIIHLKSGEGFDTIGCDTCKRVNVIPTDKIKQQVAYERLVERTRPRHSWDKPKLWFT